MIHVVAEGDSIPSIAAAAGLFPETIWDHPENNSLRELRKDMNVLFPGDRVFVPEKRRRTEKAATGQKHTFLRKGIPSRLRLQLFDVETPRANQQYELTIDGKTQQGTTDEKGVLEAWVPSDAKEGRLQIGPQATVILLKFGHMDPLSELAGVQKRLTNLGYPCGADPGQMDEETKQALQSFQRRFGLKETGELDDATRTALSKFHDRNDLFDADPWLAGS